MITHIFTPFIFALMLIAGCNEPTMNMSMDDREPPPQQADLDAGAANVDEPPPPVVVEEVPGPKKWPQCWLSSRLSAMNAFRISGFGASITGTPIHNPNEGRLEFRGHSKNPSTYGNCVLNWLRDSDDADNTNEPWINHQSSDPTKQGIKQRSPGMHAALTCTADATPECHCITVIPKPPYNAPNGNGFAISLDTGLCVRKDPDTSHERPKAGEAFHLFHYNRPDPSQPNVEPENGRCKTPLADAFALGNARMRDQSFLQQNQDIPSHPGAGGSTCRTDFEPFAPLDDEKDWYADKIRDWATTTCTDQTTNCRCYLTHLKSGHEEGKRSSSIGHGTCLLCKDGTCNHAILATGN